MPLVYMNNFLAPILYISHVYQLLELIWGQLMMIEIHDVSRLR